MQCYGKYFKNKTNFRKWIRWNDLIYRY